MRGNAAETRTDSWVLRSIRRGPSIIASRIATLDKKGSIVPLKADTTAAGTWRNQWRRHQHIEAQKKSSLTFSEILAAIAVIGRCVVMPLLFLLTLWASGYRIKASFFLGVDDSYFAYKQLDPVMKGGCIGCVCSCRKVLLQLSAFGDDAILSKPVFQASLSDVLAAKNFSRLSPDALALADQLDTNGAVCATGINEWGTPNIVLATDSEGVLATITTLGLSLPPQMLKELEAAVQRKHECVSRWSIGAILRLYKYQNVKDSLDYSSVSVADINTFPHLTDCRPDIRNEGIVGEKLAFDTNGDDLLAVAPDVLKLFPYEFNSSLPDISRYIPTERTTHGAKNVTQPLFKGFYGGCRVRTVNTTGVYVEDSCTLLSHWKTYGLMVQVPDDIPVCTSGGVCVHDQYNSEWEYTADIDPTDPTRVAHVVNTFRSRYADTININISVLPAMIVAQILVMGIISFYPHERSLMLTQIWAYRCQNGRMQLTYLAQVTYHLAYNSNKYYLGLATGTLSRASVMNLTFSFFAFNYSFINLLRARSGKQILDRHFRVPWEILQFATTTIVGAALFSFRLTSFSFIGEWNGEVLRRTSALGAKYCGLNDSCFIFNVNLLFAVTGISLGMALVVYFTACLQKCWRIRIHPAPNAQIERKTAIIQVHSKHTSSVEIFPSNCWANFNTSTDQKQLTTFEQNCLGGKFTRLFHDCQDLAYVSFNGKTCTTTEAILLSGHQFFGRHVYHANSVILLRLARFVPRRLLRTFNVILIRWQVDPENGTVSQLESCVLYDVTNESTEAMPLA